LRPRDNEHLTIKSVSRDTALLLYTLQTPGALPSYVVAILGEQCDVVVAQMVLDGILEIAANGQMLSGPAAHEVLFDPLEASERENLVTALSRRALEYAEALEIFEPFILSTRLYAYNRIPASSSWRGLLPDEYATERYLGIANGIAANRLSEAWIRVRAPAGVGAWIAWQSRHITPNRNDTATYKLYVSPACRELREWFKTIAEVVSRSAAFHWKVGIDAVGLLRPDKIVVHFRELAELQATASLLAERLRGCSAQGVPFTAQISSDGLLSWGVDPPADAHSVPWLVRESWRSKICNKLATALVLAKMSPQSGMSASRFAKERLRLEGIDIDTWTPTSALMWTYQSGMSR
jgi:hypothetical protein